MQMRVKILRVRTAVIYCVILLASALCVSAQQRPLLTDDIDITPAGALEISAGVDFYQDARFPLSGMEGDLTRLGNIRIKTGIAPNVELQLEGVVQDYVSIDSINSPSIPLNVTGNSTHDFGDIIVSAKIKLRNEKKYLPAIGLKFGFEMPNTDQAKGIGTNQINIFSKIILQKKFGSVVRGTPRMNLMGNIGIGLMSAPLDRFSDRNRKPRPGKDRSSIPSIQPAVRYRRGIRYHPKQSANRHYLWRNLRQPVDLHARKITKH